MWDAPWHWALVAIVAIALFGYKKLPDASRSLGRSLRIFKTEIKGMTEDDRARESANTALADSAASTERPSLHKPPAVPVTEQTPAVAERPAEGGTGPAS